MFLMPAPSKLRQEQSSLSYMKILGSPGLHREILLQNTKPTTHPFAGSRWGIWKQQGTGLLLFCIPLCCEYLSNTPEGSGESAIEEEEL